MRLRLAALAGLVIGQVVTAAAQGSLRKIGAMEVTFRGLAAADDPNDEIPVTPVKPFVLIRDEARGKGAVLDGDNDLGFESTIRLLPPGVVDAAMRVLGYAWSVANAPHGTLPRGGIRIERAVVVDKALALAAAGRRRALGQPEGAVIRDLAVDFFAASPLDPGLDQILRQTEAGHALARALGIALTVPVRSGGLLAYEKDASEIAAVTDFLSLAVKGGDPLNVAVVDAKGRRTILGRTVPLTQTEVPGTVLLAIASRSVYEGMLGFIGEPVSAPYAIEIGAATATTAEASVNFPRGDGSFARAVVRGMSVGGGARARLVVDLARPDEVVVQGDANGDGTFETTSTEPTSRVLSRGPRRAYDTAFTSANRREVEDYLNAQYRMFIR